MKNYDHKTIEKKWQAKWEDSGAHRAKDDSKRPKFYCLDMFPYPSGEGLHVGHWRGYVLSDIMARYQKLQGKNILHPMGYDAFGLPAENAAIKENSHPKTFTDKAIKKFRQQLQQMGAMYDWKREISSSDPEYYRWTQWLFLQLYKAGLAYRAKAPVNWCPSCQTVLANEQVITGECERCGTKVVKKELTQWFFKITNYAEKLLENLDSLNWPEQTKTLQRHWIGKSEGALIKFPIPNTKFQIDVFTTRPDTLFGATFMVLAPEHPLVQQITTNEHLDEVEKYIETTRQKTHDFRETIDREKTGVFTGAYAINPVNLEKIPIWIADYILYYYGQGACMSVPAHDQRDFEFATRYRLPIKIVICPNYPKKICPILNQAFVGEGYLIDSDRFTGIKSNQAKAKITSFLQKKGLAEAATNYRLRDWLISRQRYWGAPIPIIFCQKCGEVPVPEEKLPVLLPQDVEFRPTGESPLNQSEKFVMTTCPRCGGKAKRETDTMDTFVDSSWYYFRFTDPKNDQVFAAKERINYWLPVDLYIGGIEHATMHLLYARFISLVLHDLGIVNFNKDGEPFTKLFNIGLIYLHGAKMSKSKGNIVNPDELVEKYGADVLRGYEMFVGPVAQDAEWQISGISGIYRFLEKFSKYGCSIRANNQTSREDIRLINKTIQKVTEDIEHFRINTVIAALMEFLNKASDQISLKDFEQILIVLSPIFPHLAEEIWQKHDHRDSIFNAHWPTAVKEKDQQALIIVQVNGKVRDTLKLNLDILQHEAEKQAKTKKVKPYLQNKKNLKTIYIPGKVINFVVE